MSYADTTIRTRPFPGEKWDKTFAESTKVDHRKVTFTNRYGITRSGTSICRRIAATANWPPLPLAVLSAR